MTATRYEKWQTSEEIQMGSNSSSIPDSAGCQESMQQPEDQNAPTLI
jgi:hypothetical protein